jgi:hypothetical protein
MLVSVGFSQCRGGRSIHSGRCCGSALLAVQVDSAALCVVERPPRDGAGAGEGGRRRALQDQRRVRFLGLHPLVGWVLTLRGRTVRPLGVELKEVLLRLCRSTALHCASLNGHTETALALVKAGADVHCKGTDGYGFWRLHPRAVWLVTVRGRTVRPLGGGAAGVAALAVQAYGAALCVG